MDGIARSEGAARALSGQVALVTGAAVRIGRAIASALAAEGAAVMIHYRSSERQAAELRAELSRGGSRAWTVSADLDDPAQAGMLVDRVVAVTGRVDVLVNSASIFPATPLSTLDSEGLARAIRVNAWAPLILSRSLAALFPAGRIVNLLDAKLAHPDDDHLSYVISKLALSHLTRILALELAPRFTVNAVAPGPILPPVGRDDAYLRERVREVPLGRGGSPHDVARAVVFLVESPFITGQTIFVDGGQHLR